MRSTAGFCGPKVRGDCRVTAWRQDAPRIEVRSRIQALYGEQIAGQAKRVLAALGAEDFSLLIEDEGALPFTIAARIEAAVKRVDPSLCASAAPSPPERPTLTTRRTRLYLPGNTPKFFINAGLYGADAVILDLEDSVPPDEKDAARILVRHALLSIDFRLSERIVRINSGPAGLEDIAALKNSGVQTLLVPKVEHPNQLQEIDRATGETLMLMPLVESALGVANAFAIATATPRVVALSLGLEDYLSDLGATRSESGVESAWALAQIVNAARAASISPLGPVFSNFEDVEGLERSVKQLTAMGFDGFSCIHPQQVRAIHSAMLPDPDEVERAEETVRVFREAVAAGQGAVAVGRRMVDAPVAAQAERLLKRAGRAI